MVDSVSISPANGPVNGTVRPPGSKSLTNRALIVAALAKGRSHLTGVLDSQDTRVMVESLKRLGIRLDHDPGQAAIQIDGCGGVPPAASAELFLENSGTSIRFLTALLLGAGTVPSRRKRADAQRPIGDLTAALNMLGAKVHANSTTAARQSSWKALEPSAVRCRLGERLRASFWRPAHGRSGGPPANVN